MQSEVSVRLSSYRWVIVSLLFFATLINYYNRIVLSVVIPYVKEDLGITDIEYSYVLSFFQFGYMFGSLLAGKVIDRLGTKLGYWLSIFLWSVAAAMHAAVRSAVTLAGWRGLLGTAEAGNFPAAIKSVSEWFPPRERALATSLFNSGPHIAMITGAPLIAIITLSLGWRWAFLFMGLTGIVLAVFWPFLYRKPDSPSPAAGSPGVLEKPVPWRELLRDRSTWGLMIARFISDPVWWFYIYWLPDYLNTRRGLNIREIGFAIPLIYIIAIIMGNAFGWLSGRLIKNGWNETRARKTLMIVCAACMPFTAFAASVDSMWAVILLVGLACGAHTGWSANMFALITDQFPSRAVGSVTGISTFTAGVGGLILSAVVVGYTITYFGYLPVFILMGTLHPVAVLFIYFMVRKQAA
ncbi:MAG: MFS transporter [Candidatus Latescibacterota bacterium]